MLRPPARVGDRCPRSVREPEGVGQVAVAGQQEEGEGPAPQARRREQRFDASHGLLDGGVEGRREGRGPGGGQPASQFVHPCPAGGHGRDDGDAQDLRQALGVDPDAAGLGLVGHVQAHRQGEPRLRQLQGEQERPAEVLGVGHQQDRGPTLLEQDVPGHPLVVGDRHHAVDARGVEDASCPAVHVHRAPGDLDRGSRVVGDRHVASGQRGEERGLPDVGVAHEDDRTRARLAGAPRVTVHERTLHALGGRPYGRVTLC